MFREKQRWARTARLKLRDGTFNTLTRQASFIRPARDGISLRHMALNLFDREWPVGSMRTVRLIGFGVANFTESPETDQGDLFGESPLETQMKKRERLADALDAIHRKHRSALRNMDLPMPI
jgi:hypothetical protein